MPLSVVGGPKEGAGDEINMGTRGLLSEGYFSNLRARSRHHRSPKANPPTPACSKPTPCCGSSWRSSAASAGIGLSAYSSVDLDAANVSMCRWRLVNQITSIGSMRKPEAQVGHSLPFRALHVMSALPSTADICRTCREVRVVPKADIGRATKPVAC